MGPLLHSNLQNLHWTKQELKKVSLSTMRIQTKSSKWNSRADYAHIAGFICYYVKDLNTGDEYLSHTEAITR
ncbi:hypothetical protein SAMN04487944_11548 [Gracilibacillus ureilyticus]|uniref:Uncharacterized protein n=1 Tax=Gracilibacillus ureilyticus TaxID=531814 RepID=A0A1H9TXZ9_9BACI|nr:hypothetical protein SAMN04487944_11548 [Gracilibacillus ureilyticus]